MDLYLVTYFHLSHRIPRYHLYRYSHLVGGGVKVHFLVKSNLELSPGLIFILGFNISLPVLGN